MAAVSSILLGIGAAAAVAGTAHSIESSKHGRRLMGQERNRQKSAADAAERDLKERERQEEITETRDRQRAEQRRRISGLRNSGSLLTGRLGGSPEEGGTLLGQ